ncbi:MAG: hypothetical protein ABI401_13075 [Candidatus Dormibacter sp.]
MVIVRLAVIGHRRPFLLLLAGFAAVSLLLVLGASGRIAQAVVLRTVSPADVQRFGMSFSEPSPWDRQLIMSPASALAIGQRSNPEMAPVKEEILARAHSSWGNPGCVCWVLVKAGGSTDQMGRSKLFELVLVDARSGAVVFAGGNMFSR